jgi:DNA polymerase I-like protein with 3'-5' exonuclease and polymerase domains
MDFEMIYPHSKQAYELLHAGTLAFSRAEQIGLRCDTDYCERKIKHLNRKIARHVSKIEQTKFYRQWKHIYGSKTKLTSNHQLAHLLYKVLKIKPMKMSSSGNQGATDVEALEYLNIPEVDMILETRKWKKTQDYLKSFLIEQVGGIIHPFNNLNTVTTFRSSVDRPPFQQIPKRDKEMKKATRHAIYPAIKGFQFGAADFSGIEVTMAGIYTKDEKLVYDIVHGDMHKDMAIELFKLDSLDKHFPGEKNFRQGGKNGFVFPEFYGDYYGNCVKNLLKWAKIAERKDGTPGLVHLQDVGLITLKKDGSVKNDDKFVQHVKNVEDDFWNVRYKTYNKWKDRAWKDYQKKGYLEMHTGFRCQGAMSKKNVTNYPFQGTAFHCLLWTFIEMDRIAYEVEKWNSKPTFQIHDELTLTTDPDEKDHVLSTIQRVATKDLPEAWDWIDVPLEMEMEIGEVDGPWDEMTDYEGE